LQQFLKGDRKRDVMRKARIVFTGGPCGGKTTALSRSYDYFSQLGYRVIVVPEVATMMIQAGFKPLDFVADGNLLLFQDSILTIGQTLEEESDKLAQQYADQPVLVLCDRGALDGKAYCSKSDWELLLAKRNVSESRLRDERYDAVIHMVSAADGAVPYYSKASNPTRQEEVELAREVDRKLQEAWTGHPHLRIIDNSTDFEAKIRRTLAAVSLVLGEPVPMEMERKFALAQAPIFPEEVHVVTFDITQIYLLNPKESERIRARSHGKTVVYTHCRKLPVQVGQRIEIERMISSEEYHQMMFRSDPARRPIFKHRHCFVWEKRHYEVDEFLGELKGLYVLETEVDSLTETVNIPPFLSVASEVTGNSGWDNSQLALGRS
jgi:CYTH domain-containing protein/predicted ATPase